MVSQMIAEGPVGSELRTARRAAGLTREQLAVRAGIGSATIYRIETGRSRPNRSTLRVLSGALAHAQDEGPAAIAPPALQDSGKHPRHDGS